MPSTTDSAMNGSIDAPNRAVRTGFAGSVIQRLNDRVHCDHSRNDDERYADDGTLKRGYWNHDAFCQGVLEIREAQVRGRLYEGPEFPVLEVPDEDILAYGTANHLADVATQAGLSDWVGSDSRPAPECATTGT